LHLAKLIEKKYSVEVSKKSSSLVEKTVLEKIMI